MGETDPFVCLLCLLKRKRLPGPAARVHPGECALLESGDRAGMALSYLTPDGQWHTIWRTLANPGE
ncbi:hypothetical protein Stsp02_59360 [Streptomyces sp. NBRC 14336]|uniref:hypothetical protein n=1 Tax=Streptomyces sp. NBRC 14336 TaxID=3030992 RepID=UPI0024A2AA90|nr:hypothetical protein [Streptomyces sp. NBRC 14336]WBO76024.1 hypothetical protein SBE_006775 [Streptomyces sp. SBE_14.2]GLW50275.1 hypothetical protein Stsp02_59360 [Streptomyces sp. NBRC 14336]